MGVSPKSINEFAEEYKRIGKRNIEKAKEINKKFFIGRLHISEGVRELGYNYESIELDRLFKKFMNCDWGEGWEDAHINEQAIQMGFGDIMGVYKLNGKTIWIMTNLNENTETTIFLPEEW